MDSNFDNLGVIPFQLFFCKGRDNYIFSGKKIHLYLKQKKHNTRESARLVLDCPAEALMVLSHYDAQMEWNILIKDSPHRFPKES